MTDEEKSRELARSSFADQMAMLGYEPNGNPKDMVEVVRCKDCKQWDEEGSYLGRGWCGWHMKSTGPRFFCADGEIEEDDDDPGSGGDT